MALFAIYYVNATMFWHCHIINGVTIVHSHIHTSPHHSIPNGGHTALSLTLISALDGLCFDHATHPIELNAYRYLCYLFLYTAVAAMACAPIRSTSLRAPPAVR